MAKLTDNFFNRIIEGNLELSEEEKKSLVEGASAVKILENIEDAQGHKRFIEGDITLDEISGLTQRYGKWSLSGSHLLIVVAGTLANTTQLNGKIASLNLPKWIVDKIQIIYGIAVVRQTDYAYANDGSSNQTMLDVLAKQSNEIQIHTYSITASAERQFRIQFDLLIDNESE